MERTQERAPLDWAQTQDTLGTALAALGSRQPTQLAAAVAAFREALKERTREHTPFDWAQTQRNLGSALQALGERTGSVKDLQEAVATFTQVADVDPGATAALEKARKALERRAPPAPADHPAQ